MEGGPRWPPPDPEVAAAASGLPLEGVRVLDLSRIVAGPFAGMILGDLGADVIKVERAGAGDDPRRWGPPFLGTDAAYFLAVNRNRRSLAVDLDDPAHRRAVAELAEAADVVLENFLPAQAAKLGIDDMRRRTGAVWVSVRGAGSNGPAGAEPGVDAMVQARSGLMSVTGDPATGPVKVGVPVVDIVSGLYAAVAAVAGLVGRGRSGAAGGSFEVPLLESALSALMNQGANWLVGGVNPGLMGNDHPNIAPYGPFPTSDGRVFLGATSELQFSRLVGMLGCPEMAEDPDFSSNAARLDRRAELIERLSERTARATTADWLEAARRHGVLAGPVNDVASALSDPHVEAVGLVTEVATDAGPLRLIGSPILVDGRRPPVRMAPPGVGQHNPEILTALGVDP